MKVVRGLIGVLVGVVAAVALPAVVVRAEDASAQPATQPATVAATDADALRKLADQEVVVVGDVSAIKDFSPRVAAVKFKGNGRNGFVAVTFADQFPAVHAYFDGDDGKKLVGQHVQVSGKISLYKGVPQIVISDPAQVKVIDASK